MDGRNRKTPGALTPLVLAVTVAALLGVPVGGQAAVITFGSDLSKPANLAEAHGPDAVFWNVQGAALGNAVPSGSRPRPASTCT